MGVKGQKGGDGRYRKGQSGNPAGRSAAQIQMIAEARECYRKLLAGLTPDVDKWIRGAAEGQVSITVCPACHGVVRLKTAADPAKAAELVLKVSEFFLPKVARMPFDLSLIPLEEIAAELSRREAEEQRSQPQQPPTVQ